MNLGIRIKRTIHTDIQNKFFKGKAIVLIGPRQVGKTTLINDRKIYFYDNGIRNMIINNLNPVELRNDKGALWENFLISERKKIQAYHKLYTSNYFWRTVQKQEIDFVEESGGKVNAYEFKWKSGGRIKIPKSFLENYDATGTVIDRENFRLFVKP